MPFNPQSPIYQLSATWAPIMLIALAVGIVIGIWYKGLFNYKTVIPKNEVARHRKAHAIFHWLNAIGFILCIVSAVILFKWVANPNEITTYILHFVGATMVMLAISAVAIRALVYEPKKHGIHITREDWAEFGYELLCYLGLAGNKGFLGFGTRNNKGKSEPPTGTKSHKYTATERVMSYPLWVIFAGLIIISGIIKALRYVTGMPDSILYAATKVHDISAICAMILLLAHAGAVILIKTNWPLLRSMFTLTTPKDYGK